MEPRKITYYKGFQHPQTSTQNSQYTSYSNNTGSWSAYGRQNQQQSSMSSSVTPASTTSTPNGKWPSSLQDYVERTLAACQNLPNEAEIKANLKKMIEARIAAGLLYTEDWSRLPLPTTTPASLPPEPSLVKRNSYGWERIPTNTYAEDVKQRRAGVKRDHTQAFASTSSKPVSYSTSSSIKPNTPSWSTFIPKPVSTDSRAVDLNNDFDGAERLAERRRRFASPTNAKSPTTSQYRPHEAARQAKRVANAMRAAEEQGIELDLTKFAVKGTCTVLEKKYLRLTSVPDPATVRPEHILRRALTMVLDRWTSSCHNKHMPATSSSEADVTYLWVCEQLKSIRQDLTIQHIKTDFTVNVYETHARIALREHDMKEFNQCLTQLQDLYTHHNLGKDSHKYEFAAYGILYMIYTNVKYRQSNGELANLLAGMPTSYHSSKNVRHALAMKSAVSTRSFATFFLLYQKVPGDGKYLVDLFVNFVRYGALQAIFKSYRPNVSLNMLISQLKLDDNQEQDREWIDNFLATPDLAIAQKDKTDTFFDGKASFACFSGDYQWEIMDGDQVQHTK